MSATLIDSRSAAAAAEGYELKITRVFDAPRELVWKAWTDPEMGKEWMGPRGFKTTEFTTSEVAGGQWQLKMTGQRPGSEQMVHLVQEGTVLEVKPPELLKYTFAWKPRSAVGLPDGPFEENVVTVRFEAQGGKTVMHFTQAPFATESERDGHMGGWNSAFDCFAEFMLRVQPERTAAADDVSSELHLRRFFAAPRQLVFDAWTKPELLKEWWGPKGATNELCELEARSGGTILIHMRGPDGNLYPFAGRFVEFYPPYRFHFTLGPVDPEGSLVAETWTSVFFDEVEGGTELVLDGHVTNAGQASAERYLKGMRMGWGQSLDKLAELVKSRT